MDTYEQDWRKEMREKGIPESRISEMWELARAVGRVAVAVSGLEILEEVVADVCDYIANHWDKWVR